MFFFFKMFVVVIPKEVGPRQSFFWYNTEYRFVICLPANPCFGMTMTKIKDTFLRHMPRVSSNHGITAAFLCTAPNPHLVNSDARATNWFGCKKYIVIDHAGKIHLGAGTLVKCRHSF